MRYNIFQGNYHEYIDLYNEAAKLNGFPDASMMKVDPYESKTFIQEMEDTWQVEHWEKVCLSRFNAMAIRQFKRRSAFSVYGRNCLLP